MRRVFKSVGRWPLAIGLAFAFFLPATDSAVARESRVIEYSVGSLPAVRSADEEAFRRIVHATLNDPRGWALGGSVRFRESRRGRFKVMLARPAVVDSFGACSAYYSCRVGSMVLINSKRWRNATSTFPGRTRLHAYRQHVINHEVGHALGMGHTSCRGSGRQATVMQQQSKSLSGCRRNAWPTRVERQALARKLRVQIKPLHSRLDLGNRAGEVAIGDKRAAVRAILGRPDSTRRRDGDVFDRYKGAGLTVRYTDGVVLGVSTRARRDSSATGIRPGISHATLKRRLPELVCGPARGGAGRLCVHTSDGPARQDGTSFLIREGRVSAIAVGLR